MIEVNTLNIINAVDRLNSLISNYEEIQLNIFNNLKEICDNWQEHYTNNFSDQVYEDKKETDLLIQNLKEYKDFYSYIYSQYSSIGKKVMCNLDNKNKLIESIQVCEEQLDQIINDFSAIDNSFNYPEYNDIQNQKQKAIEIKKQLSHAKATINETFTKINSIENQIKIKINNLEEIHIN